MKVHIDELADALYLRLDESNIIDSVEVYPGIILDFNEDNQVVGIEVLNLKSKMPPTNLKKIQLEIS